MSKLSELEQWYLSQCGADWEHTYGIKVETVDNPGWSFKVDLTDTEIEDREYVNYSYGVGEAADTSGSDWLITKVEDGQFVGYGGPHKLEEIIEIFLKWAVK